MAFSCQMDDAVDLLVLHQLVEGLKVADVHLHKLVVGLILDILQIRQVARIRQLVEVDDVVFWILVYEQAHHMAPNKACSAGNDYILHI